MEVKAIDPYCPADVMTANGVAVAESLSELYSQSDIVSIHIPATPETTGSIGKELIGQLPKGAVLINTARKEVINEHELAQILEERPDLKYFADVKPKNAEELQARYGNRVFFTPKKSGAQTAEANMNAGVAEPLRPWHILPMEQIVSALIDRRQQFKANGRTNSGFRPFAIFLPFLPHFFSIRTSKKI